MERHEREAGIGLEYPLGRPHHPRCAPIDDDTVVRELLKLTAEGKRVQLGREDQLACFGG